MDEKHLFNRLSQEVAKHPWHDAIQERRSKDFQEPDIKCVMNCEKFMECGGLKKKDCEFWDKVAKELKPTIKRALEETFEPTKCMNEFVKEDKMKEYLIFSEKGISTELTGEGAIVLKVTDESGGILDGVTFDIPINSDEAVILGHELINLAQMQVNRDKEEKRRRDE